MNIQFILLIKILLTLIFWCIPSLFFPASWFVFLGFPNPNPIIFIRLLGSAYLALTLDYILGLKKFRESKNIQDIVSVGILSNGSASIILLLFGSFGYWNQWGVIAQVFMWFSFIATALITIGLLTFDRFTINIDRIIKKEI